VAVIAALNGRVQALVASRRSGIAPPAGDDAIATWLRGVRPPLDDVEGLIALLTSAEVGVTLSDMSRIAALAPDVQDSYLKDSLGVRQASWRARLRTALDALRAAPAAAAD
jgi:hypothetical protein